MLRCGTHERKKMVNSSPGRGKGRQALGCVEQQRNPHPALRARNPRRGFSQGDVSERNSGRDHTVEARYGANGISLPGS